MAVWLAVIGVLAVATPGFADTAYDRKLAACRKAAEVEPDLIDFKCDWRVVTRGAAGAAFTGRYVFAARGYVGEMTVLEGGGPDVLVAIQTVTNDRGAHTCQVGLIGKRDDDVLILGETSTPACVVRIASTRRLNTVTVTATEACRDMCGMRGVFEGPWRLRR